MTDRPERDHRLSGHEQDQFLTVLDRDEAARRFWSVLDLSPLGTENVPLRQALGRTLAHDVAAGIDVPPFDRSNFDGFAVRAADTYGASEATPVRLRLTGEAITPGIKPSVEVGPGQASVIATGAMLPRGADAVVMVEDTEQEGNDVVVRRAVAPGAGVMYAGSDIARGEIVLRRGTKLSSREIGVLAALGLAEVPVWRRPQVAILSTGDELRSPGEPLEAGQIFDSNAYAVAAAVEELGGEPRLLGIIPDDADALRHALQQALRHDLVILSGGTSKGAGDISYRVVSELPGPGIVAHGIALKPGKPLCLAAAQPKPFARPVPIVILPGFPTSAIFTFHEFVAPVIRALVGLPDERGEHQRARLAVRVHSDRGRTEFVLVGLAKKNQELVAYPMGKGSGSVTAFARADGFITIPQYEEFFEEGQWVDVQLMGRDVPVPDLVCIGSHCVGFDHLLSLLHGRGVHSRALWVGSMGGLEAARRGECDVAGVHLLDPASGEYNVPFLTEELLLVRGYTRMQGVVFRADDPRFVDTKPEELWERLRTDRTLRMVNRNRGSGTRVLMDELLGRARPEGYNVEVRTHNAVVAAVAQGRADWGVAIETVARQAGLAFVPLREERYDFLVPVSRFDRPAVDHFVKLLRSVEGLQTLRRLGFGTTDTGTVVSGAGSDVASR